MNNREFWIDDILNVSRPNQKTAYIHEQDTEGFRGKAIHVIEHKAYQELEELMRMRLVACSQATFANTEESLAEVMKCSEEYKSVAYRDWET